MQRSGGIGPLALICLLLAALLLWAGILPAPVFDVLFVTSLALSLMGSLPRLGASRASARFASVVFAMTGILLILFWPAAAVTPYLGIALAYAQLSYVFAHGLMPGRQPILEQLIREMAILPDGAPEFWRFVRGQCQLWTVLGAAMSLIALAAVLSPAFREIAGQILTLGVILQLAVFVLSHSYANHRYQRPETWLATLKAMFRPAIWSKLEL